MFIIVVYHKVACLMIVIQFCNKYMLYHTNVAETFPGIKIAEKTFDLVESDTFYDVIASYTVDVMTLESQPSLALMLAFANWPRRTGLYCAYNSLVN